ncbi:MAG: ankyrin repeat domain-containing protein [Opitutales bacterium]|nr:ankyrin repeat domain-containing protein [Opitutales bacterium]
MKRATTITNTTTMQLTTDEEQRYVELQMMALDFARDGETDTLASMLYSGLAVNLEDARGNTLLMLAAYHGNLDTARLLLENGADPERKNARGQTPLAGVAFKGHVEMARLLIEYGANASTPCRGGQTPIQFAALFGHRDMCELLLEKGAYAGRHRIWGLSNIFIVRISSAIRSFLRMIAKPFKEA